MSQQEHQATHGCFLEDKNSKELFVTTNRHVSLHGNLYLKKYPDEKMERVPYVPIKKVDEDESNAVDFDILKVPDAIMRRYSNQTFDNYGAIRQPHIFNDSLANAIGRRVHLCRPSNCTVPEGMVNEGTIVPHVIEIINKTNGIKNGIVENTDTKNEVNKNVYFGVKSLHGRFAKEGDSGSIVALTSEKSYDKYELIGIVCGSYSSRDNDMDCIVCLFLPYAIKYVEQKEGRVLELYQSEHVDYMFINTKCELMLKTPEYIQPLQFDLVERFICLTCLQFPKISDSEYKYEELIKGEQAISERLNNRQQLSIDIPEIFEDGNEFIAYANCSIAIDYLFAGNAVKSERHIKVAITSIMKSPMEFRYLCRMITCGTWYCLLESKKDSLSKMKALLKYGLEFLKNHEENQGFPNQSIGNLYHDYARYYMKTGNFVKAAKMSKKAVDHFNKIHITVNNDGSFTRLVQVVSQFVITKMTCGEDFENCQSDCVDIKDIEEAENTMELVKCNIHKSDKVQQIYFFLCACDLNYRKRNFKKAFEFALQSKDLAKQIGWREGEELAEKRQRALK